MATIDPYILIKNELFFFSFANRYLYTLKINICNRQTNKKEFRELK